LERAGDPEVACVEADDLMAAVEDAPVARPRTPERDRFNVTSWRYTITGRRHVSPPRLFESGSGDTTSTLELPKNGRTSRVRAGPQAARRFARCFYGSTNLK